MQHDWRVIKRSTRNVGLRWALNTQSVERYNRMNRGFAQSVVTRVSPTVNVTGGLRFAGVNGQPRAAADTYMKAIQPRFGFAYKLTEKLVMRGGWGRYYLNPSNGYIQSTGFSTSTPLVASLDGGRYPIPNLL